MRTMTAAPQSMNKRSRLLLAAERAGRVVAFGGLLLAGFVLALSIGPQLDGVVHPVISGQSWAAPTAMPGSIRFAGTVDVARDCLLVQTNWSWGLPTDPAARPAQFARWGHPRLYGMRGGTNELSGVVLDPPDGAPTDLYADLNYICGPFWTMHQQLGPIYLGVPTPQELPP